MRYVLLAGLVAGAAGCCHAGASTGWSFQVGRPAVVQTTMMVSPTSTAYTAAPMGAGPLAGPIGPMMPMAAPGTVTYQVPPAAAVPPAPPPNWGAAPCVPRRGAAPAAPPPPERLTAPPRGACE